MANRIAVSFEDDLVRVVYASSGRGNVKIRKMLLLKNNEFDDFLSGENSREFIVVADFKVFYSDILYLPPAKDKYLRRIVESEIRKKTPELKDFSFSYTALGESVREGKKSRDVFFYAVNNADLFQIVQRFEKHNKTVKCILPPAAALSRLIDTVSDNKDELQLCIVETGLNKTLFLVKNGKLYFIRTANSLEGGINDIDVHDINMTVNYCRQTLRMTPSLILLVGGVCLKYEATMGFTIPAACVRFPDNILVGGEDTADWLAPLAAVMPGVETDSISVLPVQYSQLTKKKKIVTYCATIFVLLSLVAIVYLKKDISEIIRMRREADLLRTEIRLMESNRQSYEMLSRQLGEYAPLINFVNSVTAVPDMQKALISLASLKTARGDALHLNSITIAAGPGSLNIQMQGSLKAERYSDTNKHYHDLLNELRSLAGMTTVSDSMDINTRNFHVEVQYSGK